MRSSAGRKRLTVRHDLRPRFRRHDSRITIHDQRSTNVWHETRFHSQHVFASGSYAPADKQSIHRGPRWDSGALRDHDLYLSLADPAVHSWSPGVDDLLLLERLPHHNPLRER